MKKQLINIFICRWLLAGLIALSSVVGYSADLRHLPAESCAYCHVEIYKQWQGSMHANSTALKDPIHGAFYRKVVGDPMKEGVTKGGKYPVCLKCHAPAAAKDKRTKLDASPAYSQGVNCVACHTLSGFKGVQKPDGKLRLGIDAYEYSDDALQGNSGRNFTSNVQTVGDNFHPYPMTANQALMRTNAACLGCHDKRKNAKGVSLCQTGNEIIEGLSYVTCQSCHMPKIKDAADPNKQGIADHSMHAGHNPEMVKKGLLMTIDASRDGSQIDTQITLHNQLPHNLPTGAPFRNIFVKVTAFDKDGNVVWQNYKQHPIKEDAQAMLMYTLGDEAGNPTGPPTATQVLSDTRLKPNEARVLSYQIPADGVLMVRAEAFYNLLTPPLVKKLDAVLSSDLKAPYRVGFAEARI